MLNGKFVCTEGNENWMVKGRVYEFFDGVVEFDNGKYSDEFKTVEDFNSEYCTKIADYVEPKTKENGGIKMIHKIEKVGYEYMGFKLGQRVAYDGIETIIIGFDEEDNQLPIIIKCIEAGGEIAKTSTPKVILEGCEHMGYEYSSDDEIVVMKDIVPQPFTKQSLKDGYKVEYKNGDKRLVLLHTQTLHATDTGEVMSYLDYYNDDLTKSSMGIDEDAIVKVHDTEDNLIWEREIPKTPEQIEIERLESEIRKLTEKLNGLKGLKQYGEWE